MEKLADTKLQLDVQRAEPGLFLSYDPVFRNYSYKGTDHNNPIYPVFLASAMRNEETDTKTWHRVSHEK